MKKATARRETHVFPLLTIKDLEHLLRLHRRTIARLCAAGRLPPPMKIGGSRRWKAEEVYGMLERTARKSKEMT